MGNKRKSDSMTLKSAKEAASLVDPSLDKSLPQLEQRTGKTVTQRSYDRIRANFLRMEQGSRHDDRTPIYKTSSRKQVVTGFDRLIRKNESLLAGSPPGYREAFDEIEAGQRKNIGPMSMFVPASEDCAKKIGAVWSDKPLTDKVNARAYELALKDVENLMKQRIVPVSIQEALDGVMSKPQTALDPDTNSGWPYCMSRWNSRTLQRGREGSHGDQVERTLMLNDIINDAKAVVKASKHGVRPEDLIDHQGAISFQRTVQKGPDQLASEKSKRYVVGMPKFAVVAGKTVQIPFQEQIKQARNPNGTFIFPGFHTKRVLDTHMQAFLKDAHDAGRRVLSGDISSFDATVPPQVLVDVAKALSKKMSRDGATLFNGIVYADTYKTSIITPIGVFEACPSSVKSGSIFTSGLGSGTSYFLVRYGHHAGYYTVYQQCHMGDDFIVDGDGVSPQSISQAFADFGMEAHPDKQFVGEDCLHFLQMTHVYGLPGGQGSVYRILGNVLSVEDDTQMRWDERNRYAYILQATQRLNNAIFNPYAEVLIKYVQDGDSLRLGADLDPNVIIKRGGSYAERKLRDLKSQNWRTSVGMEFEDWPINRVLRGEVLPPPGVDRFRAVYGVPFKMDLYESID